MKFLVIGRPHATTIAPSSKMVQELKAHLTTLREKGALECVYGFVDRGAVGICNADSPDRMREILTESPVYLSFDWEVHALTDYYKALDKLGEMLQKQGL